MASDESDRQPSFKVQDRRRFSATGDAREDVEDERPTTPPPSEPGAAAGPEPSAPHVHDPHSHEPHLHDPHLHEPHSHEAPADEAGYEAGAEITFASFVFSLSTQALVHLGEIPDPVDGSSHQNLEAARQIIDIIAILKEKTRGNLDAAENSLLESALYDLRMRYVDRARRR